MRLDVRSFLLTTASISRFRLVEILDILDPGYCLHRTEVFGNNSAYYILLRRIAQSHESAIVSYTLFTEHVYIPRVGIDDSGRRAIADRRKQHLSRSGSMTVTPYLGESIGTRVSDILLTRKSSPSLSSSSAFRIAP